MFGVRAKYLYPQQEFVFRMIREILLTSRLEDEKRLREIISSLKARLQSALPAAGHSTAASRAMSYDSAVYGWQERIGGISFYRVVEELESHFEERKDELIGKLRELMKLIFRPENLTVSLISGQEGRKGLEEQVRKLKAELYREPVPAGGMEWRPEQKNEGFRTSGQVQYVAVAGNFRRAGFEYTGALRILRTVLNYDYLWMNLRVRGGAYGCMGAFRRTGECYLVSYRDPHLKRTLEVYEKLPEYLRHFHADEREMTKYIIGTVSELDVPLNASAKGAAALNAWFTGMTEEDFQRERDQILDAEEEDIRKLADLAEAVLKQHNICVVGSEKAVEDAADVFKITETLIRA